MKKFEYTPPEQPRELILKLGQKITDRIGHTVTAEDPEYYGLEALVTDEMAEVALKMKVRKPMTLAQIVKATGKEEKALEELLQEMSNIGLLEYNWENPKHEKQYVLPMYVPGSAEFFNMKLDQIKEHPEVASFFERMAFLPLQKVTPMVPPGGAGIGMHVIPVEKAIKTENESVSVEHISHWLDKYDGKYAAGPCSCRYSRGVLGEGCADDPEDWCIGVGDMADYLVETNKGHYITREKVMEILQRAEDNGFVHQITNIDGEDKIFAVCNCNVNICNALRTSQLFNTPNMSRSAYVAKVETKDCVACGRCVEYCPAGAVKLGQKLCTKDGTITYPKHELPDNTKWGPEKWDMDYRDNNRINCFDTGTAPCKTACPAHIAVQGYLKMAAQGRYTDALALIKKENPFPAVCGRVCNHRCEDACTRGTVDQAVAIDDVKKFIAELDLNSDTRYIPPVVQPSNRGTFPQKIAIIGGGPAGLSAAVAARKNGTESILILERDKELGGILNQCIHNGFGLHTFQEELTGPEYAGRFITQVIELGIKYKLHTMVMDISADKVITAINREDGMFQIQAKAVILAMGCRERSRGALNIPGYRPAGIFSAGTAQRLVNIEGYLPGRKVVILGSGDIGLIMARRMTLEGAEVQVVAELMPYSGGLKRNIVQCLDDFGIPLKLSHTVIDIKGKERVEGITLAEVDKSGKPIPGTEEEYECDTLLLSVGLIPENEISRGMGVELNPVTSGPRVNESLETNMEGVFACGNVLHVHDLVDFVSEEAAAAGRNASMYVRRKENAGESYKDAREILLVPEAGVRYTVPSVIRIEHMAKELTVRFRVGGVYKNCYISCYLGKERIIHRKRPVVAPGEMEQIKLTKEQLLGYPYADKITLEIEEA